MKFIVTGGAGFIGHNVIRTLQSWGHECFVLDNFTNYGFIPSDELAYLHKNRYQRINNHIYRVDICDQQRIDEFFRTFSSNTDAVIHLASFPRQKVVNNNPILGAEVMSVGLVNLLEKTKSYGVKKFVYISSSMVYGDFDNDVTEESICRPQGQYGILKYAGELLVKDYARSGAMDYTIIRPSAVYGEWDVEDRVVSKFMLSAMRNKTLKVKGSDEVLDFTYVEDAAQGIALAAVNEIANNQTYNITRSDQKLYTLLDAANLAITIAGKGNLVVEGKDQDFPSRGRLCIDKAVKELGYNPTVSVEQGFERYHAWFSNSEYWQNNL